MARAGQDVTLVRARPALARDAGAWTAGPISADGDFEVHPKVIGDLEDAEPVDVIVLA